MVTATLRNPVSDGKAQTAVRAAAAPVAARPATAPVAARPAPATAPATPVAAIRPVTPPAARPAVVSAPSPTPAIIPAQAGRPPVTRKLVARQSAPTVPVAAPAAAQPVIDVESTVVTTPTPVEGVTVESVNTVAATSAEDALLGASMAPEQAPAPAPAPAAAPKRTRKPAAPKISPEEAAKIEFDAGYTLALNGAAALPDAASDNAIAGWNRAIEQGLYGTAQTDAPAAETAPEGEPVEENAPEVKAESPQALIVRPPAALAQANKYSDGESFIGDFDESDIRFPQLKIVQGSGQLSTQFNDGTILYADLELLPPADLKEGAKNPVLKFAPIQVIKQFREHISKEEQDNGQIPRIADTIAEVEEMGGTVHWVGKDRPANYWAPSAKCLVLLELPDNSDHPNFIIELDGKFYAVAVYYTSGVAYRNCAKIILNTTLTSLQVPVLGPDNQPQKDARGRVLKRAMPYKNFWTMGFAKKPSGEYMVWTPVVKLLAKEATGPELRDYCSTLVSGQSDSATE